MAKTARKGTKYVVLGLLATLAVIVGIEIFLRVAPETAGFREKLYEKLCAYSRGENPTPFEGHPHTVYRLKQQPGVNSLGFADVEWDLARTPGVPRIACLGASTTQSGIGANRPTYPHDLEAILKNRIGCEAETMNFGIDGWTTAETMTNYFIEVADFRPDLIVIQHACNDVWPRIWPGYRSDYSHYRVPYKMPNFGSFSGLLFRNSRAFAALKIKSWGSSGNLSHTTTTVENRTRVLTDAVLTPETLVGFRQNLQAIIDHAAGSGTRVILLTIKVNPRGAEHIMKRQPEIIQHLVDGTAEYNEILRELAAETDAVLVDIAKIWEGDDFEGKHLPNYTDGFVHTNAKGNRNKARLIADAIIENDLIRCEQ